PHRRGQDFMRHERASGPARGRSRTTGTRPESLLETEFPDDLFVWCYLEDDPSHALADERVSVGQTLSTGHEPGGELRLRRRGKAPGRLPRPVGGLRLAEISTAVVDWKDDLVHRRVIGSHPTETVVKHQDVSLAGTTPRNPVCVMLGEESLILL